MIPLWIYILLALQLIAIAVIDFRIKKISNYWSLMNVVLAVFGYFLHFSDQFTWSQFIIPGLMLFFGILLYIPKIMGPGDSKYLTTFFLIFPHSVQKKFLDDLLIATIIVASCLVVMNLWNHRKKLWCFLATREVTILQGVIGRKFPFAPVIFIAWIKYGVDLYGK